jgi:hypothetical protein
MNGARTEFCAKTRRVPTKNIITNGKSHHFLLIRSGSNFNLGKCRRITWSAYLLRRTLLPTTHKVGESRIKTVITSILYSLPNSPVADTEHPPRPPPLPLEGIGSGGGTG